MAYRSEATFGEVAKRFGNEDKLRNWLGDQRQGHQSYEAMAYLLMGMDLFVSASTVRRWVLRQGVDR